MGSSQPDPGLPLQAQAEASRLEGSVLCFALLAADGTALAAARVPVEASRFRVAEVREGLAVLRFPVEAVLEVAVPEALAAEAAAGSWRFWEGPAR